MLSHKRVRKLKREELKGLYCLAVVEILAIVNWKVTFGGASRPSLLLYDYLHHSSLVFFLHLNQYLAVNINRVSQLMNNCAILGNFCCHQMPISLCCWTPLEDDMGMNFNCQHFPQKQSTGKERDKHRVELEQQNGHRNYTNKARERRKRGEKRLEEKE